MLQRVSLIVRGRRRADLGQGDGTTQRSAERCGARLCAWIASDVPGTRPDMKTALVLAALVTVSCATARPNFPKLPDVTASLEERERVANDLTPEGTPPPGTPSTAQLALGAGAAGQGIFGVLFLKNGLRIEDPTQLRTLVPSDSKSAAFIDAFETKRRAASVWTGVGIGLSVALLGAFVPTFNVALNSPEGSVAWRNGTVASVSLVGAALILPLVPLAIGSLFLREAELERTSAYYLYPRDLRAGLGLAH